MQTVYIELYIMNSSSALASSLDLDYSVSRLSQAKRKAIPPTVESNRQSKPPTTEPRLPRVEWSLNRPFVRNATAACKCKDIGRQWAARLLLACRDRNRKSNLVGFNCQPKTEQWHRYNIQCSRLHLVFLHHPGPAPTIDI